MHAQNELNENRNELLEFVFFSLQTVKTASIQLFNSLEWNNLSSRTYFLKLNWVHTSISSFCEMIHVEKWLVREGFYTINTKLWERIYSTHKKNRMIFLSSSLRSHTVSVGVRAFDGPKYSMGEPILMQKFTWNTTSNMYIYTSIRVRFVPLAVIVVAAAASSAFICLASQRKTPSRFADVVSCNCTFIVDARLLSTFGNWRSSRSIWRRLQWHLAKVILKWNSDNAINCCNYEIQKFWILKFNFSVFLKTLFRVKFSGDRFGWIICQKIYQNLSC